MARALPSLATNVKNEKPPLHDDGVAAVLDDRSAEQHLRERGYCLA